VYEEHPSVELNALFRERPFQGAVPEMAEFVFVGLDANYARDVAGKQVFGSLMEYHEDGVRFWRRHGVHHPFLLPAYRGDGKRYHANFSRIGFGPEDASRVSFIELLHVPSVGRSKLDMSDLDARHLKRIQALLEAGERRHVFVSAGVARLLSQIENFPRLREQNCSGEVLPILYSQGGTTVHRHLHFSNYGKFQAQMTEEAAAILRLVRATSR
jgi:hypothetical protein